jgi:hypothetical protein
MELARTVDTDGTDIEEPATETVMIALLAAPFQDAVRMTHPLGKLCAVTVKDTVTDPVGTMTLGGMLKATLLVEIPTVIAPAAFERVAVQVPLEPTFNVVGLQESDTSVGVDHNAKVAV